MEDSTHLYKISPHIFSRYSEDELLKRLKRIDLCILDLDECITSAFTPVELIKEMLKLISFNPLTSRDRWLLLTFAPRSLWLYITVMILRRKIFRMRFSPDSSVSNYTKLVKDIPKDYFYQGSRELLRFVHPGFRDAVKSLSSFCKVGIITSGLEPVVTEYIKNFNSSVDKECISFYNSNHIVWTEKEGVLVFRDIDRTKLIKGGTSKTLLTKDRIREFNSHFLLAIGHDEDDVGIAEIAKQNQGLSIGFNPKDNVADAFDVIIKADNWYPINDLIIKINQE
jgi:hypothetical protein